MTFRDYPHCGIRRYEGVTAAGLQVFVYPMPDYQTQYAFFATKYGGCDRRFQQGGQWVNTPAGVAHFLEHKMFDMPGYHAMERFTALGASPNAFTSNGMTGYLFKCTEHFEENLRELLKYVTTPYFTEESVRKEQGIIGQEIRMGDDNPTRRVRKNLLQALYRNHPVRDSIAGTVESIAQITPEILEACHRAFYHPKNMVLCCAGDIDPERVMKLAELLVPSSKEKAPKRDYGSGDPLLPETVRVEEKMAVSTPVFMLGGKLTWLPDGRAWTKQLLLTELSCELFAGDGSPLYSEMYASGLINSSFYVGALDFPHGGVVCAGGRCADPNAVLTRLTDAAENFRMDTAAESRLRRLKKTMLGNFIVSLDSAQELCHTQADAWFSGFERMEYPALFEEITAGDVETVIHDCFRPELLALSVIRPL